MPCWVPELVNSGQLTAATLRSVCLSRVTTVWISTSFSTAIYPHPDGPLWIRCHPYGDNLDTAPHIVLTTHCPRNPVLLAVGRNCPGISGPDRTFLIDSARKLLVSERNMPRTEARRMFHVKRPLPIITPATELLGAPHPMGSENCGQLARWRVWQSTGLSTGARAPYRCGLFARQTNQSLVLVLRSAMCPHAC